ncbi:hypothetical protein IQ06DRAFT_8433 [Phaeosphaeriaceae sp. SRC1lsM3a]|nr:hypothetical protein IQ06DRAFT_8433 [Stagonospora sp. SRC1lsM3a]
MLALQISTSSHSHWSLLWPNKFGETYLLQQMMDFQCQENPSWRLPYPPSFEVASMSVVPQPEWPDPYPLNYTTGQSTYAGDYNFMLEQYAYNIEGAISESDLLMRRGVNYGNVYALPSTANMEWPSEHSTYYDNAQCSPTELRADLAPATEDAAGETTDSDDSESESSESESSESESSESESSGSDTSIPKYCKAAFRVIPSVKPYLPSYKCHCDRRFVRPEHFRRHLRTVHGDQRDYHCKVCRRAFSRSDNLKDHYWTHVKRGGRRGKNKKYSIEELRAILGSKEKALIRKLKAKLERHKELPAHKTLRN